MKKIIKKKESVKEEPVEVVEVKGIELITTAFPNEDMNKVVEKINEIINKINVN